MTDFGVTTGQAGGEEDICPAGTKKVLSVEELEAITEGKPLVTLKNIIFLFLSFKWNMSHQPNSFPESSQDSTIADSAIPSETGNSSLFI